MNNKIPNDPTEDIIQSNITNWQSPTNPLAPLEEEQLDLIYQIEDIIKEEYQGTDKKLEEIIDETTKKTPLIDSYNSFIKWFTQLEKETTNENLNEFIKYYNTIHNQGKNVEKLYNSACEANTNLETLKNIHKDVISKTDYLHDISEELMKQQKILKGKKDELHNELKYFIKPDEITKNIKEINSITFTDALDTIIDCIDNLNLRLNYKEARIYKMKNESLLMSLLNNIHKLFNQVISDASKQIIDPDKSNLTINNLNTETSYSLYYGKFQSASRKVTIIINYLEEKSDQNEHFKNTLNDCYKMYLSERLPILTAAVSKALNEIKDKYKNDYSVLFRSCGLFMMKVCQDEANCFQYFFKKSTEHYENYIGTLCQHLYDVLRPCLITINHIEILSELCGILRKEMLNDKIISNNALDKYVETMNQLLEDIEERLVFRTNVFFQHDLLGYVPSSGDLAYPEKLIQMENISLELQEYHRTESRSSIISLESQEVANINNTSSSMNQFRSYTGNSPADLHGMWYPTVKRTLVCLSRLYFCLDKETFQGLAQEALSICVKTIQTATDLISNRKSKIDGYLFQIKHLLIVREQIAPFQVDFTIKEIGLDFSHVQQAAIHLINHRNRIFSFNSNNALLEFLLEGTPKVKEYLIDSRKEVDKQLKLSCEEFISNSSNILIGDLIEFCNKEKNFKVLTDNVEILLKNQDWAKPELLSNMINEAQKNIKNKIPKIQKSMQLYLANRETEFILFRPIKNNVINVFINIEQILINHKYSSEEQLLIACPSAVQVGVLISSVSLTSGTDKNI